MWTGGVSGLRPLHQEPRSGLALLPAQPASQTRRDTSSGWTWGEEGLRSKAPSTPGSLSVTFWKPGDTRSSWGSSCIQALAGWSLCGH